MAASALDVLEARERNMLVLLARWKSPEHVARHYRVSVEEAERVIARAREKVEREARRLAQENGALDASRSNGHDVALSYPEDDEEERMSAVGDAVARAVKYLDEHGPTRQVEVAKAIRWRGSLSPVVTAAGDAIVVVDRRAGEGGGMPSPVLARLEQVEAYMAEHGSTPETDALRPRVRRMAEAADEDLAAIPPAPWLPADEDDEQDGVAERDGEAEGLGSERLAQLLELIEGADPAALGVEAQRLDEEADRLRLRARWLRGLAETLTD